MKITDLMVALHDQLALHGDVEVVSGVRRSGYAEAVVGMEIKQVKLFNPATNEFDGEKEKVLDLSLDESSFAAS